jgi:hypothetical protein
VAGHGGTSHPPQLSGSVCVSVQKLDGQNVGVAAGHAQLPLTHTIPKAHELPQDPQLLLSLDVSMQTPAAVQICCDGDGQLQVPPLHVSPEGHTLPQNPQLPLSLDVSMQAVPHACCDGDGQWQTPPAQLCPGPTQDEKHCPQLCGSLVESTHTPPQRRLPWPGHSHAPAVQTSGAVQAFPHRPQLLLSLLASTHVVPHSVRLAGHAHWPIEQSPEGQS